MKSRVLPKYSGLCSSCARSKTCKFPRESGAHIYHCEEWDGTPKEPRKYAERPHRGGVWSGGSPGEKIIGLCRDCGKKETCKFTRPEGGVWHCEEYD